MTRYLVRRLLLMVPSLLGISVVLRVAPLRDAARTAAVALATYSIYPLGVILSGNLGEFQQQKLAGLERFVGLMVTTGLVASTVHAQDTGTDWFLAGSVAITETVCGPSVTPV